MMIRLTHPEARALQVAISTGSTASLAAAAEHIEKLIEDHGTIERAAESIDVERHTLSRWRKIAADGHSLGLSGDGVAIVRRLAAGDRRGARRLLDDVLIFGEKGAARRLGVSKRVLDSWARVSGLGRTDRQSVAERALAEVVGLEDEVTSAG